MPKLVFDAKYEAAIQSAVSQVELSCKVTKRIIQKRKKRADELVVDVAPNDMVGLHLILDNIKPIRGWPKA